MQLIFLLLADVEDVVFGNFVARQDERQAVANIGEIFLGDRNPTVFERRLGSEYNVLKTPSLIIKDHVENFLVFSGNRVRPESVHLDFLPIGVLVASLFKLLFFRGEALDDLLWRAALGLRRIKRPLLGDSAEGQKPRRQDGNCDNPSGTRHYGSHRDKCSEKARTRLNMRPRPPHSQVLRLKDG